MIPFVDLKSQYEAIQAEVDEAIQSCLSTTQFIGGERVKGFESAFATFSRLTHCIACANGTDAIELALSALNIGPGDEVIVPALTWISTAGAVNNVGAEPVFVDVEPNTRTLDPSKIEKVISENTKAIIPVHLYGLPAAMHRIREIADKHDLFLIEDCAQSHGAEIHGRRVGTWGDLATFSFYPGKNLGAYGDAGAVLTNDEKLAGKVRRLANHGQRAKHDHQIIGRNSRMDTLQAAVLSVKLKYLNDWTEARIRIASTYNELIREARIPTIPDGHKHVFHLYVIEVEEREKVIEQLRKENIGFGIHYPRPLHLLECYAYKNHQVGDFPIAEKLCNTIISLPMYPELRNEMVEEVASAINSL